MGINHVRHSFHYSKKSLPARSSRPAPLSKRKQSHRSKGASKVVHYEEVETDEEEGSMAVSFLNYWYVLPIVASTTAY
jgi:hypothetical protein